LQDSLTKLDLRLKCPQNVCVAQEIINKAKFISTLEDDFPKLKQYTENIFQDFLQRTNTVFDSIRKNLSLSDETAVQEIQKLGQIKNTNREHNNSDLTSVHLREHEYCPTDTPDSHIEKLRVGQTRELEAIRTLKDVMNNRVHNLNSLM
jgi:hypothetical protein